MKKKLTNAFLQITKNAQAKEVFWEISPTPEDAETQCCLGPEEYLEIDVEFECADAEATSGIANIYLNYEDIPGYADGQFVLQVEKAPLVYDDQSVGIGIKPDRNVALNIKGSTLLNGQLKVEGNEEYPLKKYLSFSSQERPLLVEKTDESVQVDEAKKYSIHATGYIACNELHLHCDERIKADKQPSNSTEDLEKLLKVQVTDYSYIDTMLNGEKRQKKVLGQQVAQVYPQAVDLKKGEAVPDIMQQALFDPQTSEIELASHSLKVGDKVQILYKEDSEDKRKIFTVKEVSKDRFKLDASITADEVFVYGRVVDDFHLVDFDALSMLNISATQELCKQLRTLEQENNRKNALIDELRTQLATLSGRIEKLEK